MEHLDASRSETLLHLFVFLSASSVYFKLQISCYLQLARKVLARRKKNNEARKEGCTNNTFQERVRST